MILFEMAYPKRELLTNMHFKSEQYIYHLIMIFLMPKSKSLNHWKEEIYGFYPRTYKCKGSNKPPTTEEMYSALFGYAEDLFVKQINSYIDVINLKEKTNLNVKDVDANKLKEYIHEYTVWLVTELNQNEVVNKNDVYGKLDDLIYLYNKKVD